MTALIIHGHFYQPPRENPWTGMVETELSAAPFHDWNERIHSERYAPNALVPNGDSATADTLTNNYTNISFNFGPTLMSWLESNHPDTYARIIKADCESALARSGHGNAIAQAYGHAILPLCNERDMRTQIRWGLADFRYRFGREPESLWLPETACDDRVMSALIDEGLRYVILAPHQAKRVKTRSNNAAIATGISPNNTSEHTSSWTEVDEHTLDTSHAYRWCDRNDPNKSVSVFFYNGPTARAIAFEKLLSSSRELVDAFTESIGDREMLNIATDGETYGHHFKFGDVCLAHALTEEAPARGFQITNY